MRLLEFPCGRRTARLEEEAPRRDRAAAAAAPEKGKRRGRALPWRPSLVAISEDAAMVAAAGGGTSLFKGRAAASTGSPKTRASYGRRIDPRPFKDADYGHYGVPVTVPAFAPAAFIF